MFRYGCLFPLDVLRSIPYLLVALPACAIAGVFKPASKPALQAALLQRLFAWKTPTPECTARLAHLMQAGGIGSAGAAAGFFMWPASIEHLVLGAGSHHAHHAARCQLVRQCLPPAENILDLGGSGGGIPEGGLLHMGYPHHPRQVTIIDIPPETQFWKHAAPATGDLHFQDTTVSYHYSGMHDLSAFAGASVDGVWSGQSMEHVPVDLARQAMAEIFRVLRPGGWFCMDTPNHALTRLAARVGFIHPEHFHEYTPDEAAGMLRDQGFEIVRAMAVSPMPISKHLQRLWRHEIILGEPLGDDASNGYSFFLHARKPFNP